MPSNINGDTVKDFSARLKSYKTSTSQIISY
jgi:hypothetical protein